MNVNELKANLKLIGFEHNLMEYNNKYAYDDCIITILYTYNAIRLDNYLEERSLFMSLNNPNLMERIIKFIEYEILVLRKNK